MKRMKNNYLEKLLNDYEAGRLSPCPGINHVHVLHDDDCSFLKGKECDCEPEIKLLKADT